MKLAPRIRQEVGFAAAILLAGFLVGVIDAALGDWRLAPWPILRSGINGFFIALACIAADLTLLRRLSRLPFALVLITRTVVFAAAGAAVVIVSRLIFTGGVASLIAQPKQILATILITLAVAFFASLFVSLRLTVGKQAFLYLLLGRYRQPVEETRMFMFVDIASSTALAEKIGHVQFHQLIHAFWCDVSDAILAAKGEIYKYAGDGAILTWSLAGGDKGDPWLECFFAMRDSLERKRGEYLRRFGAFPRFRASLHCGKVVAGEIGDSKREVAFLGDTVNTAERILEACKIQDRDFLISEDAIGLVSDRQRYRIEPIPGVGLRGKEERVTLYAVGGDGVNLGNIREEIRHEFA
jgi:class 3 adenylate cyclase